MDDSGTEIWKLIENEMDINSLIDSLSNKYIGYRDEIEEDVNELVSLLKNLEFIDY